MFLVPITKISIKLLTLSVFNECGVGGPAVISLITCTSLTKFKLTKFISHNVGRPSVERDSTKILLRIHIINSKTKFIDNEIFCFKIVFLITYLLIQQYIPNQK